MGFFETLPEKPRGYEYSFQQEYRVGINKGLNEYESFIKYICKSNPLILVI